jgi:carboxymethylenebutenolidase
VRFDLPRRDDRMTAVIRASLRSIDNDRVNEDTAGLLAFLDGESAARADRVGCVGFCMSGRYAVTLSAYFGARIVSAASLYPVGLVTEDEGSPHKLLGQVTSELYFGIAETDTATPPETLAAMRTALDASGVRHEIEMHPNSRHGYCFTAGRFYAPQAAEATWAKMFALWERTLK